MSSGSLLQQFAMALAAKKIRVIDLSQPLSAETPILGLPEEFGKSWPFRLEEISRYDSRGPAWYWNNFACGEHTGTHFDAPVHWVTGKDLPLNTTEPDPCRPVRCPGVCDRRDGAGG